MLAPCICRTSPVARAWLTSRMLRRIDAWADPWYHEVKRGLFWPVSGRVLEIGPGAGCNIDYYPPGTRLYAVEPNPFLHGELRARAQAAGIRLRIVPSRGEQIPLPSARFDHVVTTLVLCSVRDPAAVLGEIRRLLRPGGQWHFVEHVRSDGWTGAGQRMLYWPWRWMFDGCDLRRDTAAAIRAAGFDWRIVSAGGLGPAWLPVRPHIVGRAGLLERSAGQT